LTVDPYDPSGFWPESRVFSIASSPGDRHRLRLCYSVKGRYTRKMEQTLAPGVPVWVKLPYGDFVIEGSADAVLIAGGTGISAFTAYLESLTPETRQQVWLFYGARNPDLLLFRDLILRQSAAGNALRVWFFVENPAASGAGADAAPGLPAGCLLGRLALEPIWTQVVQPEAKTYYLSGPPAMLASFTVALRARGVPAERVRTDAWE
jgi:ferredoxin-NADP reductase